MNDWHELGHRPDNPPIWKRGPRDPMIARIVEDAPSIVASVPYDVSVRWLFYRLLQEGYLEGIETKSGSYKWFINSVRRPAVYSGLWEPDICTDEGRKAIRQYDGYDNPEDWFKNLKSRTHCYLNICHGQEKYVMIAFEAMAMADQFRYHTGDRPVELWPFGGDPSIPYKYELARHISYRYRTFGVPVVLLYFGDLDKKGMQIPESAFYRIRESWLFDSVDFTAYRVGLNWGDEIKYDIPEQPDKPGAYQWEALEDEYARELIASALDQVFDATALKDRSSIQSEWTNKVRSHLESLD